MDTCRPPSDAVLGRQRVRARRPDGRRSSGPGTGVVQVELRASGRRVGSGWSKGSDYGEGLCQALGALRQQPGTTAANELMLSLGGQPRELSLADEATWQRLESNRGRGLFGYEIRLVRDPALVVLVSPFDFVASNRSFIKILRNAIEPWGLTVDEARAGGVTLSEFETRRFRIDLGRDDAPVVPLVRGTRLVPHRGGHARFRGETPGAPRRLSRPLGQGRRPDGLPVPPQPRHRGPDPQQRHPAMDGHALPHPRLAAARVGRAAPDGPQEHRLQPEDDVRRRGRAGTDPRAGQGQAGRPRTGRAGAHRVAVRRRVRDGPRPTRDDHRPALEAGRRVPHLLPTGMARRLPEFLPRRGVIVLGEADRRHA